MDFIAWFEAYLGGQGISSMRGITPAGLAAAIHPRILRYAGKVNFPITLRLLAKSIIKHMTGDAVTPLIIAAHTSALIASTFVKLRASPTKVASASTT
jgi:hypothetical protein